MVSRGEKEERLDTFATRFDVYLQVLLFVMVTGSNPFSNIMEALEGNLKFPSDSSLSEV